MKRIDVIGAKFGMLTILGDAGKDKHNHRKVLALCDCGNRKVIMLGSIRSGLTKSCGCIKDKATSERSTIHGLRKHELYKVFHNMKYRCYNKKSEDYENYGGKGVVLHKEWLNDFKSFYDFAIKNGWKKGLQIDRINNDGNYEPENCRFVTPKENCNNKKLLNKKNTTGFRGVTRVGNKFLSRVRISGVPFMSKRFNSAFEAAKYRDEYCIKNGISTTLNFNNK